MGRPSKRLERAVFAVVFSAGGFVVGFGAYTISAPTPPACEDMAEYAMEAFKLWGALTDATRERGDAPDVEARAVGAAEVDHLLASLEAIAPKYDDAAADCVGAR